LWLTLALVIAYPAYAAFGYFRFGVNGIVAASVAGAICWIGAAAALLCTVWKQRLAGLFLGMIFRMGLPLVAGLILHSNVPELARAGIFGFVLCYYFLALVVETLLAVRMIPRGPKVIKSL